MMLRISRSERKKMKKVERERKKNLKSD